MPAGSASDLVTACKATGITHACLVRHASSAPLREGAAKRAEKPHDWKFDDQMRVLTPKGINQCEAASSAWFKSLDLRAILSSPARRASETAMRMMAAYEEDGKPVDSLYLRMVASSHPAGMSEVCESLFETMGYGPLRTFFAAEGGEQAFQEYGDNVCAEMSTTMTGPSFGEAGSAGTCIALFGHAVFLNAIAFKIAQASNMNDENKDKLLDLDLGETEGIYINLEDGSFEKKVTPPPPAAEEA
ncbi:hypothetical protein TrLO_g8715 [Triparma laevis f. longispina]|uniref:Uncharacterized protein n=1 Tax=Triparma laevis f. longispina TaxID=1714387 RepID=A0A9W7A4N8_9STRA|nr:hypothetical protein TrLO_g8715 [Triparma laevis f. longispina]